LGATIGGLLQNQVGPLFDQLLGFAPGCIPVLFGDDWSSHVRYALEDVFTACHALQNRIFTPNIWCIICSTPGVLFQLLKCTHCVFEVLVVFVELARCHVIVPLKRQAKEARKGDICNRWTAGRLGYVWVCNTDFQTSMHSYK